MEKEKKCCSDGNVEKSKLNGCGCSVECCINNTITESKQNGCGCS